MEITVLAIGLGIAVFVVPGLLVALGRLGAVMFGLRGHDQDLD